MRIATRFPVARQPAQHEAAHGTREPAAPPSPGTPARRTMSRRAGPVTPRWILARLTGQTARRSGHTGIVREKPAV